MLKPGTKSLADKHSEALRLANEGRGPEEIAEAVGWTPKTVRNLLRSQTFSGQLQKEPSCS